MHGLCEIIVAVLYIYPNVLRDFQIRHGKVWGCFFLYTKDQIIQSTIFYRTTNSINFDYVTLRLRKKKGNRLVIRDGVKWELYVNNNCMIV